MKRFSHPLWLLASTTLPVCLLLIIQWNVFASVDSELTEKSIQLWKTLGITLAISVTLQTGLAIFWTLRRKSTPLWYTLATTAIYLALILVYVSEINVLLPFSIPDWLLPGERTIYAGSFLMPTLLHGLIVMVVHLTPKPESSSYWQGFLWIIGIPALFYLLFNIVLPLFGTAMQGFSEIAFITLVILGSFGFLFFVIRLIYQKAARRNPRPSIENKWKGIPRYILYSILGIVAPLLGLYLSHSLDAGEVVGNYSSLWFYILAVANGLSLLLPENTSPKGHVLILIYRATVFPFIAYFFFVFAPFLPLSFIAIIFFGIGLLMLVPLILGYLQLQQLVDSFRTVSAALGKLKTITIVSLCFMALPIAITANYMHHRHTLHRALTYLYQAPLDRSWEGTISTRPLRKALAMVEDQSPRQTTWFNNSKGQTPILNWFYRYTVLDNLTLSIKKRELIYQVFLNQDRPSEAERFRAFTPPEQHATLDTVSTRTEYNKDEGLYYTWVDLSVSNPTYRQTEYGALVVLPEGVYVTNYYLDMPEGREFGLLTEKKAALWVYQQITSRRRDPGILYYQEGNVIALKVFPVPTNGNRTTGFQLVHREPTQITIEGRPVRLGAESSTNVSPSQPIPDGITYLSTQEKAMLTPVKRTPYFHFIVEAGQDDEDLLPTLTKRIDEFLAMHPTSLQTGVRYTLSGAYSTPIPAGASPIDYTEMHAWMGGYFPERALEQIAYQQILHPTDRYPIPVLVPIDENFNPRHQISLWAYLPENPPAFLLTSEGIEQWNPRRGGSSHPVSQPISWDTPPVLTWPTPQGARAYLKNTPGPGIICDPFAFNNTPPDPISNPWLAGLTNSLYYQQRLLHPDRTEEHWQSVLKTSFQNQVLSPSTAFIVVESEAQKEALLRKQKQTLLGKEYLDAGTEEIEQMSEPGFWILAILFGGWVWWRRKRTLQ